MYMYFSNVWNILSAKISKNSQFERSNFTLFVHAVKFLMLQMDINFVLYNRYKDIHRGIKFSCKDFINNED